MLTTFTYEPGSFKTTLLASSTIDMTLQFEQNVYISLNLSETSIVLSLGVQSIITLETSSPASQTEYYNRIYTEKSLSIVLLDNLGHDSIMSVYSGHDVVRGCRGYGGW